MDCIELKGLIFHAFHGLMPFEQELGNEFLVDIWLYGNFDEAAISDNIDKAVNYQEVYKAIEEEMKQPSKLIENVCHRILKRIKNDFDMVDKISVKLTKKQPPLGGLSESASVKMSI